MKKFVYFVCLIALGCGEIASDIQSVRGFDVEKYLGTWYEIARLDHSFEQDLHHVTATYSLRNDGGLDVVNKGRHDETGDWEVAEGKAYFVDDENVGRLKVSFFGPFYGGYHIIALDKKNYSYSMVTGPNRSYLWILSRQPTMQKETLNDLINLAKKLGYDTDKLIFVKQQHPRTITF